MKKIFRSILFLGLGLMIAAPEVAFAQDDAYMTPSRAKELREKLAKERAEADKKRAAERAKREQRKIEEQKAREKRSAQYAEDVDDWYNRRQMKVTVEEMERNLDELEGRPTRERDRDSYRDYDDDDRRTYRGGKYSQRLRRFSDDSDVIVLENVDRVYVLNDMDYNPWTNSYYGRDWHNGVNISINVGPYYPYYSSRWWRPSYSWGRWYDPWYYDPWYYDPWYYDPWYRSSWHWGYHYPRYYGWGWGYTSPWRGSYYSGYWNGYHDAYYGSGYYVPVYGTRRTYSSHGRSAGTYYDRSAHNEIYGRALGNSARSVTYSDTYNRSAMQRGNYDEAITRSNSTYNRSSTRNDNSGMWNRGRTYDPGRSTNRSSTISTSPTRSSGGSISSGGGSTSRSSSGGSSGRSSGASRRGR